MKNQDKQSAATNVALLKKSLLIYKKSNPEVRSCFVRSDNAGNYHSSALILPLWAESVTGRLAIPITAMEFTAAGDGKSAADGFSAIIKRKVAKEVNMGEDATDADSFAKVIVK